MFFDIDVRAWILLADRANNAGSLGGFYSFIPWQVRTVGLIFPLDLRRF